jgi:hypothetical protein
MHWVQRLLLFFQSKRPRWRTGNDDFTTRHRVIESRDTRIRVTLCGFLAYIDPQIPHSDNTARSTKLRPLFMKKETRRLNPHTTADKLPSTAVYVRQHDVQGTMGDVQKLAKRYPGQCLAVAVGLGFLFERLLRNSSMRERLKLVGGTLSIESQPGAGTTIYARAPLYTATKSPMFRAMGRVS